ncbi:MAG: hypothetical protein AAFQ92_23070 [Bacteroidota bacterium]
MGTLYSIIQGTLSLNELSMGTYYLNSANNEVRVTLPLIADLSKSIRITFIGGSGENQKKIYLPTGNHLGDELQNGITLDTVSEPGSQFFTLENGQMLSLLADRIHSVWRVIQWESGVALNGGGISQVFSDGTLAGNGTSGNPLRVAQPGLSQVATNDSLTGNGTSGNPLAVAQAGLSQVATDDTLNGNGTSGNPLSVAQSGLSQVSTDDTLNGDGTNGNPLTVASPGLSEVVTNASLNGKGTAEDPLRVVTSASSGNWSPESGIVAPQTVNFMTPFVQQGYEGNMHTGTVTVDLSNAANGAEVLLMHDGNNLSFSMPSDTYLVDLQNQLQSITPGKFNRILLKLMPGVGGSKDILVSRVDVDDYEVYDTDGFMLLRNWQRIENFTRQGRGNTLRSTESGWTGGGSNYNAIAESVFQLPIDKDAKLRFSFPDTGAAMVGFAMESEPSNSDFQYRILSQAGGAFSRFKTESQISIGAVTAEQVWGINITRSTGLIEFGYLDGNENFQTQTTANDPTPQIVRVRAVTREYGQPLQDMSLWVAP